VGEDPGPTYYELLEVGRGATTEEIQSAFRRQAKRFHPDAGGTAAHFRLIKLACDTLSDPQLRRRYDLSIGGRPVAPPAPPPPPPAAPQRHEVGPSRQGRDPNVMFCGTCGRQNRFDADVVGLDAEFVCRRCGSPLGWPQPFDGGVDLAAFGRTKPGQSVDLVWAGDEFTDDEPVRVRGRILRANPGERTVQDELSGTTIRVIDAAVVDLFRIDG
jgi:hypothetical protein